MKNTADLGLSPVKTKYNTRVVANSGFKSSEVKELLNMKKQKVIVLFHNSKNTCTEVSVSDSFAQGGGAHLNCNASTALCDSRLFSEVAKGCASRKTYLSNTRASPCCGSSIDKCIKPNTAVCTENTACENSKNAVYEETRVTAGDSDKMKVFLYQRA